MKNESGGLSEADLQSGTSKDQSTASRAPRIGNLGLTFSTPSPTPPTPTPIGSTDVVVGEVSIPDPLESGDTEAVIDPSVLVRPIQSAEDRKVTLPLLQFPDALGVTIHEVKGAETDFQILDSTADAGFGVIRDDMRWHIVESERGVYDFSAYDRFVEEVEKRNLRILWIVEKSNLLYEEHERSIRTAEGRAAFAKFAHEAALRYKDYDVIWEIWNEPDQSYFWPPAADVDEYYAMFEETVKAIREADPSAVIVAPGTAIGSAEWLRDLFELGALEYVDAVSVHPYRALEAPEGVVEQYEQLRQLISDYAPEGKDIPIISSEWGYSSVTDRVEPVEELQAKFAIRQFLVNLSQDVLLSVWFNLRDGSVVQTPLYGLLDSNRDPKPVFHAVKTLTETLGGYQLAGRVSTSDPGEFILRFQRDSDVGFALWNVGGDKDVQIKLPSKCGVLVSINGDRSDLVWDGNTAELKLVDTPQYLLVNEGPC